MSRNPSLLLGTSCLVVYGTVNSSKVNEVALNDWWTNEHLPERLSTPGFLRARRYCYRDEAQNTTDYLTLYETETLETLTSEAYMDKLNNPTPGTSEHVPTLATMQRSACKVIRSGTRSELKPLGTGVGGSMLLIEIYVTSAGDSASSLLRTVADGFAALQKKSISLMTFHAMQEDRAATAPGSSTSSYANNPLRSNADEDSSKWLLFFEFSTPARSPVGNAKDLLTPLFNELEQQYNSKGKASMRLYDFMCSVRQKA